MAEEVHYGQGKCTRGLALTRRIGFWLHASFYDFTVAPFTNGRVLYFFSLFYYLFARRARLTFSSGSFQRRTIIISSISSTVKYYTYYYPVIDLTTRCFSRFVISRLDCAMRPAKRISRVTINGYFCYARKWEWGERNYLYYANLTWNTRNIIFSL